MTWTQALVCWLFAAALGVVSFATDPQHRAPGRDAPLPGPSPAYRQAYALDRATLRRVDVRRGTDSVVFERTEDGWRVVAPTPRAIPIGLVQAFVDQLADGSTGERIEGDPADPSFGLAEPQLVITASTASGAELTLAVGERTPTGTAAYGLVEEEGAVVLVGLNLLYYSDLLFGG